MKGANGYEKYGMERESWRLQKNRCAGIAGNFLEGLKNQAAKLPVGEGLEVIQSFEPIPLYEVMEMLATCMIRRKKRITNTTRISTGPGKGNGDDAPERPAVITNYPLIDEKLGELAVEFWDMTWKSEKRYLAYNIRLLLSLANAVGAGRMRQAMRELLKAYANGLDSEPWTMCSNNWPGTWASASSVLKSPRPPCSMPTS